MSIQPKYSIEVNYITGQNMSTIKELADFITSAIIGLCVLYG